MKFLKLCAGLGLAVLASISVNASAQTAACTWSSVYGYGSSGTSYTVFVCKTGAGSQIASRTDTYNYQYVSQRICGTPSVASGYKSTGIKEGTYYPLSCNDIIVVDTTPPPPPPVTIYPGTSCSWIKTPSYYGYDYYDFSCANYGVVAKKTVGFPWSYSSQGYSCKIAPVSPYKVESWTNNTSCDVSKVTK